MLQKKIADEILALATNDENFKAKLKSAPIDALKAEGLSPELAEDIAREIKLDGNHLISDCSYTCAWTSRF